MKVKKNNRVVMFEISDNSENRKYEYNRNGSGSYKKPFGDFIESLGFQVVISDHIDRITINGHNFDLNLNNSSYMSKNAWNREENVRKPINRFISIMAGHDTTLIKIHFNKEYDGDKLCEKINAAIKSIIDIEQYRIDKDNKNKINTIAIAEHFMNLGNFKDIVEYIKIHKGNIHYTIDVAYIVVTTKGELVSFDTRKTEVKNEADLSDLFYKLSTLKERTEKILYIVKQNPINENLISWAENAYNSDYNVKEINYQD